MRNYVTLFLFSAMKHLVLLLLSVLLTVGRLQAQLPTNSFAVTSACPASAANPSVLQKVNTDGSLTPIGTVTAGGTPLIINALGYDSNPANQGVLYGMNVVQPITLGNFNTPPNLYRINLSDAQATDLGQVTPPPAPDAPLPYIRLRQTLNFIGDGGVNSNYFVGGLTFRYNIVTREIDEFQLYVGEISLNTPVSAAPVWRPLTIGDVNTQTVFDNFRVRVQQFITDNFIGATPQGGLQDWVFDRSEGKLVSYLGRDRAFLKISNPGSVPVAETLFPGTPIPIQEDFGAMFTDRLGNIYAVDAAFGTIYKIDRASGQYTGESFGSAFGCSRGDAVSFPDARPLPVKLSRFTAQAAGRAVRLDWATATELNAAEFVVQRSRTSHADWQPIVTVRAGNRPRGQAYSARDEAPLPGTSYYRLAMIDQDGSTEYSPLRVVRLNGSAVEMQVFPNPSNGQFQVVLAAENETGAEVELISPTGQVVRRFAAAPSSALTVDARALPAGLYHLRVAQAGKVSTAPLVISPDAAP